MKVSNELKEGRQAVLNIQMEPDEVESSLQHAYKHLVRRFHIPGFRPGKAPRDVVERFVGREALLEDAINHLAPEACDKAMEQEGLQSIAQPAVEVLTRDPLVIQATIYMPPIVEPGNYKEVKLA
ncbi:MAG: trigger factor family protein, partial [bacterium]|nr:trigger factor family protein [bacterium]